MNLLTIDSLFKSYDVPILQDVSFHIKQGELVCLLGKSGSGKSTLLNIIAGFEKQDAGEITCTQTIAYMQQKDLLLPFKHVLDNVLLPQKIKGNLTQDIKEQALELLKALDLTTACFKYPHELSGGMRQRVAFARTLMSNNNMLLLDEPFGALDFITRNMLQKWYSHLAKKYDLTTLLVTHDIDEALMLSSRMMLLDQGRVTTIKDLPLDKQTYALSQQYLLDKQELLHVLTTV